MSRKRRTKSIKHVLHVGPKKSTGRGGPWFTENEVITVWPRKKSNRLKQNIRVCVCVSESTWTQMCIRCCDTHCWPCAYGSCTRCPRAYTTRAFQGPDTCVSEMSHGGALTRPRRRGGSAEVYFSELNVESEGETLVLFCPPGHPIDSMLVIVIALGSKYVQRAVIIYSPGWVKLSVAP